MCIHTYTYTYTHIHTYTHTYAYTYTYTWVHVVLRAKLQGRLGACTTAILIMFEGQFQVFKRFSRSKLVLKTLKAVSWPSIILRMAVLNKDICISLINSCMVWQILRRPCGTFLSRIMANLCGQTFLTRQEPRHQRQVCACVCVCVYFGVYVL